jgi:chloramphenicol-sensitive protein RarD
MERHEQERAGIMLGLAAYVLWGLLTIYWKQLTGIAAFELIGQRVTWSVVLLVAILVATGRARPLWAKLRHDGRLVLRLLAASLLLAANWTTYVWAVTHGNVVETALGYFIAPLLTVTIGVVVLHERLRPAQISALALAALAVAVLTLDYGHVPGFALVLGVTWATYGLLKKLVPLSSLESLTAETVLLLPVALALVAGYHVAGEGIVQTASTAEIVLVLLSGAVTTVPLLMFAAAAKRVPLTILGPLQYAVPTINFLLGVLVYDEAMPPARLAGFVLVWLALVVFSLDGVRSARVGRGQTELRIASAAISK